VVEKVSGVGVMANPEVGKSELVKAIKRTHSWKAPGPDKIHNYWFKKFTSIHDQLLKAINRSLRKPDLITSSLTTGVTYMLPKKEDNKDPAKYRPIACLPTVYKIVTSCIAGKIQAHCEENNILHEEQKGCRKGY